MRVREKGVMAANRRKAFASKGDDMTLTRFVKLEGYHASGRAPRRAKPGATGTEHPKTLKLPSELPIVKPWQTRLLVTGYGNMKLGRDVRKGKLKGYWIYALSLEERKTCPTRCTHWLTCYGNNLNLSKRIDHTDPQFLPLLEEEIDRLVNVRGRIGVLIRLHELGDFYSPGYVAFWRDMLRRHPTLSIFGYTAHDPESVMGSLISRMNVWYPGRSMVRFSNGGTDQMATVPLKPGDECPPNAFICPEQTGKTRCCATCGVCWTTEKNVAFLEH